MTTHLEMQNRLKSAIQEAILNEGRIEGTDDMALTNTDVVEALLEVAGFYAAVHGFENYTTMDLARKHVMTLQRHIERFRPLIKSGKLPFKIVPRRQVN